jgi:dolichol-phosphate mannosyltransferase
MDRVVVDYLNGMPERNRYIRGMRAWIGFKQTAVQFDRPSRYAGDVKYTFKKSLSLAIDGIIGFSRKPLRLATYLGLGAAAVSLAMVVLVFYWRVFQDDSPVTGFTIITVAMFFLGGAQLFCLGVLGEYIGRIYEEAKGRPIYTLKEAAGFSKTTDTNAIPESSRASAWRRPA